MIVTVTMNPAIDKTVEIEKLQAGGLNRIQKIELDAGGKGINVSKTIQALGGNSIATGFLGGSTGELIEHVLQERKIPTDFIRVAGETRTNTKIFEKNGTVTELNEPGPAVTDEQTKELLKKLEEYAARDTLFVLAGSIPKGSGQDIYEKIIRLVHKKGAKVLLDADGNLFRLALEAGPDIIKPNRAELFEYAKMGDDATDEEILYAVKELVAKGIEMVAVSMGKQGAMLIGEGYQVRCPGLIVDAHSTVGAGDAMAAALAYSWDHGLGQEETIRLSMAASAGAVTTIGTKPPARSLVDTLKEQVKIERIGAKI